MKINYNTTKINSVNSVHKVRGEGMINNEYIPRE